MADPVNSDVERAFSLITGPLVLVDDQFATVVGSQAGALRASGQMCVITKAVNTASVVLPSIGSNDAPPVMVIINETGFTIRVGCPAAQPGLPPGSILADTMNGTATASDLTAGFLAVPTKCSAVFIASQSPFGVGGGPTTSPNNWHGAVLT